MTRKRTALILAAMMALFQTSVLHAQDFFIHTVTKGQGLYSISRIYGISEDDIIKLNPGSDKIIRIGQELRIPTKENQQGNRFHTVERGETLYSLSRLFNVSVNDICSLNPGIDSDNLKAGAVIAIPPASDNSPANEVPEQTDSLADNGFKTQVIVKKRVTIYRICKDFGIGEEEFLDANPQYRSKRLKTGDIINIPYTAMEKEAMAMEKKKKDTEEESGKMAGTGVEQPAASTVPEADKRNDSSMPDGSDAVNAVMLLPFSFDSSVSTDRSRMTEFTRGMLMAISRLKDEGISINLKIIDTGTDARLLDNAIANGELDNADVIFGPKYNSQIEKAAQWSTAHGVPLVLPFNADDNAVYSNPHVFQLNTPQSYFHQEIYDHFVRQFRNPNIIILDNGDMDGNDMLDGLKLTAKDHGFPMTVISADTSAATAIMENLDAERQNVFIISSPDEGPLITMLPILQIVNRSKDESIRTCLFGYPEYQIYASKHLDEMSECDTWFYSWFFTNNTLKESADFSLDFIKSFNRQMMVSYPSYAPYGFDTGYYFLRGIALYGKHFEKRLNSFRTKSVQMGFKFQRLSQWGGFINHKVFFVHFTPDYKVEKIDFDK